MTPKNTASTPIVSSSPASAPPPAGRAPPAPAAPVGEFLHDPQRVHVVLSQVRRDRAEHREAAGDARREGQGGGLVCLVGDSFVREEIEDSQRDARGRGARCEGAIDHVVSCLDFVERLAQVPVTVDAHARNPNSLREEFDRALLRLGGLFVRVSAQLGVHSDVVHLVGHYGPPRLSTR